MIADLESLIARFGAEAMGLDRIAPGDDLLDLGIDSVEVVHLLARVADATGVELPVRAVFQTRTVERLAMRIRDAAPRRDTMAVAASGDDPLSYGQHAMWAHEVFVRDTPVNNCLLALALEGELDLGILSRCLEEIVLRHEVLRTVYPYRTGGPVAIVTDACAVELPREDVSDLPAAARESRIREAGRQLAAEVFDLERGPVLRGRIVRCGPREHVLLLALHHIAYDRWSAVVLMNEIGALYGAFREGRSSPLPPLPLQFREHARSERARVDGPEAAPQLEHWRRVLAEDHPPTEISPDEDAEDVPVWKGHRRSARLPAETRERLRETARDEGATLYAALTATFAALLHRETGAETITIGGIVAGRRRLETEAMVGSFINMVVLRIPVDGDPTWRTLLRRTREVVLDALSNQDVPWEVLIRALRPKPDPGKNPYFRHVIQMLNVPGPNPALPGLRIRRLPLDAGIARFDLFPEIEPATDGLTTHIEGRRGRYGPATLARLAERWQAMLGVVGETPDVPVSALP